MLFINRKSKIQHVQQKYLREHFNNYKYFKNEFDYEFEVLFIFAKIKR